MRDSTDSDPLIDFFRDEVRGQLERLPDAAERPDALRTIRGAARIVGWDHLASRVSAWNGSESDIDAFVADVELLLSGGNQPKEFAPILPSIADVPVFVDATPIALDASLLKLFREEVRSNTANLSRDLIELERDPANPKRIDPLMRAAHSLKGAARIAGVDDAVELAHHLEDAFVNAGAGRLSLGPPAIDTMLAAVDLLAKLAESDIGEWMREDGPQARVLRERCAAIARGEALSTATVSPPTIPPPVSESRPTISDEIFVRVTAQSLNRLMSLAGESLVQARWLQLFAGSLLELRKQHDRLAGHLDRLAHGLSDGKSSDSLAVMVQQARQESTRTRQLLQTRIGEFEDHAGQAEDLNSRLYREVIASRMRPFSDGGQGFPRLVRDAARQLGKSVKFELVGADTEVDRDILEQLEAPLTHLLRNAVDHGIEPPDVRRADGKSAEATITLEARHRSGMLAIVVRDDGGGIDLERVRAKIRERHLAPEAVAARLLERELLEFLFLPGFSTAGTVTELSGRGVGLDVVHDTLRRVGGSVTITTSAGRGTAFHLVLPLTLSVVRAVLAEIAGEIYAFPHTRVDRLLRIDRREVSSLENRQFATVDGQHLGLVFASQLLDLPAALPTSDDLCILLLGDASGGYGLIVDAFRGEQDLVVRPLDTRLGKVPDIASAAILDDGTPTLIADVEDLLRSMDQFIQQGTLRHAERDVPKSTRVKRVLVVDDSITVREVQRQLLRTHGYEVDVAVDGQDGWNKVRAARYDLIVSDIDMPRMTGLELVRLIRDDAQLSGIPVVIVSYKDRADDRQQGLEVGANYYLTKSSFRDATYLDAIVDLIGTAGP